MHDLAFFAGATVAHLTDWAVIVLALLTGLLVRHVAVLYLGPLVVGTVLLALTAKLAEQQQLSTDWPVGYVLGAFVASALWISAGWLARRAFSKKQA